MVKVAAVIASPTVDEAERQARLALRRGADLVEFRLDALPRINSDDLKRLAHSVGSHAIATLRSLAEGGLGEPQPASRHALLQEACRLGFRYVDVELDTDAVHVDGYVKAASRHHQDILVSHHFDRPVDVPDAADALEACMGLGDVGKVAVPVVDVDHAAQLVELARNRGLQRRRFVLIGMGLTGMLTRALAGDVGQEIQYAAGPRSTAPGQLSLETANRLKGKEPMVLGIVGRPLGHTISPQIHEAAFDLLGLPAAYLPFDMDEAGIDALLRAPVRLRLRGFNVTSPHKETVAGLVDELDGDAEGLGAVNTVVLEDGSSKGHNTDVFGFRMSLREFGLRIGGRDALVLGAGGAARAVIHVLIQEGARVHVWARRPARAEVLADLFEAEVVVVETEELAPSQTWDLLVNATSAGTKGGEVASPVSPDVVKRASFVYDLVYNPPETSLLQMAKRLGIRGTSGLSMLLHQASKSFELWTGKVAPFEAMRKAAQEALR